MRYLVSVIDHTTGQATPAEMAAIDAYNERLQADGHWVFACGIGAPSTATVVDGRGEQAVVTEGAFLESPEYVAGFWILEAAGPDVALALATEGSKACNRRVELRPLLGG
ncbi:MAG: YciI family protein [Cellulomonas sp.]|nr:YciI family protein [Cellulomonas sp.]